MPEQHQPRRYSLSSSRSLRQTTQQALASARTVTTVRVEYNPTSPPELNPSWPRQPRRRYAVEPIPPPPSASTSVQVSHRRGNPVEELDQHHLLLQDEQERQRSMREQEIERQRDWEREQYYIRLSAEARRVNQMHQQQQLPSSARASQYNSAEQAEQQASSSSRDPQHKVYLLNCKHCGNFLSDRGMKAVLLLKPNITLYSTDAVPTSCGPYFSSTTFNGGMDPAEPPVERTCDCLTQSLGCYGCGAQVGYNIIAPCSRCTSSVLKHQRSSNGHRTVLHCSEISVRERRYVPGEPGVMAAPPYLERESAAYSNGRASSLSSSSSQSPRPSYASRPFNDQVYLEDCEQEEDDDLEAEKAEAAHAFYQQQTSNYSQQQQHTLPSRSRGIGSGGKKGPRTIRRGQVVYWSDLVGGGERTEPFDPDPILNQPLVAR